MKKEIRLFYKVCLCLDVYDPHRSVQTLFRRADCRVPSAVRGFLKENGRAVVDPARLPRQRQAQEVAGVLRVSARASWTKSLAPVPFHQNITSAPVNPVVLHPASVRARRQLPSTGNPHIRMAVPTMIACDPHMPPAGSWNTRLNNLARWSNTNYNFGARGAKG